MNPTVIFTFFFSAVSRSTEISALDILPYVLCIAISEYSPYVPITLIMASGVVYCASPPTFIIVFSDLILIQLSGTIKANCSFRVLALSNVSNISFPEMVV